MDWAYHVTLKSFLPSIMKDGLRPTEHAHTDGEPVIFIEDDEENVSVYHEPPKTVILRFKVPGFGTTDDGEYVHHDVVKPADLQIKTKHGYESLLVAMRRIEADYKWAAMEGKAARIRVLDSAASRIAVALPSVLDTKGLSWGFYSREDPRMHLQTLDPDKGKQKHRAWLEARGQRSFETDNQMPASVRKALFTAVEKYRWHVESSWVKLMIAKDWLLYHYKDGVLTLEAYPGTHHAFTREINLYAEFNRKLIDSLKPEDIAFNLENVTINLFVNKPETSQVDFLLSDIIFEGTRTLNAGRAP